MKVAAVQVCSTEDISRNLEACLYWIQNAKSQGAEFVLLPENFSFLGREDEKSKRVQEIQTTSEEFLKNTAKQEQIFLLGGGYAAVTGDKKVFNQAALYNPHGELVEEYQKIHLFDVAIPGKAEFLESETVQPGKDLVVADVHEFKVGLSICFDLRFGDLYREQVKIGANVLTVPAAFTQPTGEAHWHTLLRARAIENQCYVIAPAQTGTHSKTRASFGHALIVDPWGAVLADAGTEPGVALSDISLQMVEKVRLEMPLCFRSNI